MKKWHKAKKNDHIKTLKRKRLKKMKKTKLIL